ncbi:hypothetical protein, partial [Bordetella muralis]
GDEQKISRATILLYLELSYASSSHASTLAKQIFQPGTTPPRRMTGLIAIFGGAGHPKMAALQDLPLCQQCYKKTPSKRLVPAM